MKPMWLEVLLAEKFFTACAKHDCCKRNEKNIFCLDCRVSICQHCVSDHNSHQLLQIRRYVYHDVIRLHDIQKLLDCSRVQAYTINSARVVFLKERPQPKSNKGLGSNCESCERSLQDAYNFCSLACKVDMSFTSRSTQSEMESAIEWDTSTTHHQSLSYKVKMTSCNGNENIMDDQKPLDLEFTTSTISSESVKSIGVASTQGEFNMRTIDCTKTSILGEGHHLACNKMHAYPPRHRHHNHFKHKSFNHLKPLSMSLHSSSMPMSSSFKGKRKCSKPHRSPLS